MVVSVKTDGKKVIISVAENAISRIGLDLDGPLRGHCTAGRTVLTGGHESIVDGQLVLLFLTSFKRGCSSFSCVAEVDDTGLLSF